VLIPYLTVTVEFFLSFSLPSSTPTMIPKFDQPEKFLSVMEPNSTFQPSDISTIPVPSQELLSLIKAAVGPGSSHGFHSIQSPYMPD
jgi:hypothetical protein